MILKIANMYLTFDKYWSQINIFQKNLVLLHFFYLSSSLCENIPLFIKSYLRVIQGMF